MVSGDDSKAPGVIYSNRPAIAYLADSEAGADRARAAIEAASARPYAIPLGPDATDLAAAHFIYPALVDLAEDHGAATDHMLAAAVDAAARLPVLLRFPLSLSDTIMAKACTPDVAWLCDPDPDELIACVAAIARPRALMLRERGGDEVLPQLAQLSEEVGRIARALAQLSAPEAAAQNAAAPGDPCAARPAMPGAAAVRAMIRARRMRDQFFDSDLFADPAWDMMLDLLLARVEGRLVAVSSLCIAAAVPPTTALRWIKRLTEEGVFVRTADQQDGRRIFIDLSEQAATALASYVQGIGRLGVTLP